MLAAGAAAVAIGAAPIAAAAPAPAQPATIAAAHTVEAAGWHGNGRRGGGWRDGWGLVPSLGLVSEPITRWVESCCRGLDHLRDTHAVDVP